MNYIDPTLENALKHLEKLNEDTKPAWGTMTSQRMVEHITDTMRLATGKLGNFPLAIPEDKVEKAQGFLHSEHPLPKNFQVDFARPEVPLRNENLSDAIDELSANWIEFEEFFEENPEMVTLHPSFGNLNYELWLKIHSKHLTHHFLQFGLISE